MSLSNFFKSLLPKSYSTTRIPAPLSVYTEVIHADGKELESHDNKGIVKLGVIVGHSQENPGARMVQPYGLYEFAFNSSVAEEMKSFANSMPCGVFVEVIYRDKNGIANAYDRARAMHCDAVIELHFNAATGRAKGSLTLSTADVSDMDFSHGIHKAICELYKRMGKENMGVKAISKSGRGGVNVHSFPGGVNCLVEPFFGDNDQDAKLGMDLKRDYATTLVKAVALWARKNDLLKA